MHREGSYLAAGAAAVASAGDLLMLYAANAPRPELGLPQPGRGWLWMGAALGVLAIPLYAVGYRAAARLLEPASAFAARVVARTGLAVALLGALIHGLTAAYIAASLDAAGPAGDPLAGVAAAGRLLLVLWGLASLGVVVASIVFAWGVGRGRTPAPRSLAWANPALLTVVIAAAGLPSLTLRAFLTPAAPNLAHLVFFLACGAAGTRASRLSRSGWRSESDIRRDP